MTTSDYLLNMTATASLTLGLFGATLCLMQARDVWTFRALALVLVASSAMELQSLALPIADERLLARFEGAAAVFWLIGSTSIAPLFWHYVCALTSLSPRLPRPLWPHCALPGFAVALGCSVVFMSDADRLGLFSDSYAAPDGWPLLVGLAGEVLVLATVIQWGGYIAAIVLRLLNYRKRLHEFVSSTARRELGWIWTVILAFSLYWGMSALDTMAAVTSDAMILTDAADAVLGACLLIILLLWGLRQRPGLLPDETPANPEPAKYVKSALTPEMAARIERKLRLAMTSDHLHHDPNLSLWALARHIGASPNYISQTLNDTLGENFFDFVNRFRIADAEALLRDGDQTVLSIAFEVGFNSRSSFYTAFKKVTGQTPTAFRHSVSGPK